MALSDISAYEACLAGDVHLVSVWMEQVCQRGESLHAKFCLGFTRDHNTLLHAACISRNVYLVQHLLRCSVNPNKANQCGKTPLHFAASSGDRYTVEELIKNGGEVDCVDCLGNNPLYYASENGDELTVMTLLVSGASLITNSEGKDALCVAIQTENIQIIDPLLRSKGRDYWDEVKRRLCHIFRFDVLFSNKARVFLQSIPSYETRLTFLYGAYSKLYTDGHMDAVAKIFCLLAQKQSFLKDGLIYLAYCASRAGNVNLLDTFLSRGLDINIIRWLNKTLLYYAIIDKQDEMLRALLGRGADIPAGESHGIPLLHRAVIVEFNTALPVLINAGADINSVTIPDGETPLHMACRLNLASAVELLLQYNPDINIRNKRGQTPLEVADSTENKVVVNMIKKCISGKAQEEA